MSVCLPQGALGLLPKLAAALQPRRESGGEGGGGDIDNAAQSQPHGRGDLGEQGGGGLRDAVVLAASHFTGEDIEVDPIWQ